MNRVSLEKEIVHLRTGIRYHRDQTLDDRCYLDDLKLYELLPETISQPIKLPAKDEFLGHCEKFNE